MRSLTATRHQRVVCRFLLVALWFSLAIGPRAPASHAQQTVEHANELLALSEVQNQTDHQQALETAQEALAIFNSLGNQQGKAEAKLRIGNYHTALGNLTDAHTSYEESRQLYLSQLDVSGQAAALISLSNVAQRQGDWVTALQYLDQAELLVSTLNNPGYRARIANSFAYVYSNNGLPGTARTEYERSRDYFLQTADNTRNVNRMTMLIGYTYLLEGNYTAATTNLNEALANLTLDLDKAQCHEYLGQVQIGLQQYEDALEHLQTALTTYEAAPNPVEVARVLALIGQINEQQGELALARKRFRNALQTFQKVEDRVNESAVSYSLGKLELKARNYDQAETYLKRSLQTTEDLRRSPIAHDLTTAYSATVYERYQTYIDCLLRKHELQAGQRLHIAAFETSELARVRALAELFRDNVPAAGPHQELAKQEKSLRQMLSARVSARIRLLTKMAAARPDEREKLKADLPQLDAGINEVRRQHGAVAEKLRQSDASFVQREQPTAYSLEQIQREVIDDDQTVLLEYLLGAETSYVWAVRKNAITLHKLPNEATINKAATDVYKLLAAEPKGDSEQRLQEATAQLSKLVIAPLGDQLNARRLIIVADDALHYVPFQMLSSPANPNEPLVANYEIVNAPSASILGQLRKEQQQRPPSKKLLAAFGDPVFPANYAEFKGSSSGEVLASLNTSPLEPWRRASRDIEIDADTVNPDLLQPLAFSKFELQKLSDLGGSAATISRGFAASRENLMHLNLSDYSVLHVATHGVLNPKNPEVSGFVLSMLDDSGQPQNGFVTTPDIYALHAPVDLVVLSACRTGLGKGVRGEGLIGLTSGFMHAGASSVAATLWKVDDNATSQLMEHFYTNMLQKKMRAADALRAAQNSLRQDPRWQAPHYWAAFTLQGEYQNTIRIPPPQPAGTSRTVKYAVGLALLMLLLLGIGWIYWRRRGPRPVVE